MGMNDVSWLTEELKEHANNCNDSYRLGVMRKPQFDYEKEKEQDYIRFYLEEGNLTLREYNELIEIWGR